MSRNAIFLSGSWAPIAEAFHKLPQTIKENGVLLESNVNHTLLLKNCSAILYHGGAGTAAAALMAGIPQIICPAHYDQFSWVSDLIEVFC